MAQIYEARDKAQGARIKAQGARIKAQSINERVQRTWYKSPVQHQTQRLRVVEILNLESCALWICFSQASHYKSIAMTNNEILHADLLDILFENRNKAYGAYALRKTYNHRLQLALGISISLAMLLMFNLTSQKSSSNQRDYDDGINLSSVQIPEEAKKPDPPQPKPQPRTAQSTYTTHIAFVDETNVPTEDELKTTDISDKTVDGLPSNGGVTSSNNTNSESDIKEISSERGVEKNLPTYDAEYPGGTEKFTDFLRKYLNTPDDLEAGEKKVVIIRFMVDVDGTISKTEIVQSGGEKYDKEVIRVLRKMPKWIPAMQNGIKVATYFTQPVTFVGIEE